MPAYIGARAARYPRAMAHATGDPALEALRFPVGRFEAQPSYTEQDLRELIDRLALGPRRLATAVRGLAGVQLETPYRPGGWTARQVVHHVADSHMNAFARFRLALTEERPTIKPYDEARWGELADSKTAPIELSMALLEPLHERWVRLLRSLKAADWKREYFHPEHGRTFTLAEALAQYAWHGEHHTAHVSSLRARAGWKT